MALLVLPRMESCARTAADGPDRRRHLGSGSGTGEGRRRIPRRLMSAAVQAYAAGQLTSNAEPASHLAATLTSQLGHASQPASQAAAADRHHRRRRAEPRCRVRGPRMLAEGHKPFRPTSRACVPSLPRRPQGPGLQARGATRCGKGHPPRRGLTRRRLHRTARLTPRMRCAIKVHHHPQHRHDYHPEDHLLDRPPPLMPHQPPDSSACRD